MNIIENNDCIHSLIFIDLHLVDHMTFLEWLHYQMRIIYLF